MSDDLKWMNRHAVLLRDKAWAGIAAKENYKIRADLRPLFDAHPDSLELLGAMAERKLYREGCEFIARMTHRRAAVWWGYSCLLTILEERKQPQAKPRELEELELMLDGVTKEMGVKFPSLGSSMEDIDNFCKMPEIDLRKFLEIPPPPPQDNSALAAASSAVKGKLDAIDRLIPADVRTKFADSRQVLERIASAAMGMPSKSFYAAALERAKANPLTYSIDRTNAPLMQKLLRVRDMLETMRKGTIAQIKAAFPEKFPATPEAKLLLAADAKKRCDTAIQAVWRWIVSPDERNTTLAMEAGNAVPGTPEGLLAYTAAWSFGDLAPEGRVTVPVPPELPGTGLNAALLEMALDTDGTRKMGERYELYFKLGMDVIFARDLWPDAVSKERAPHAMIDAE